MSLQLSLLFRFAALLVTVVASVAASSEPTHLAVLVHGLHGSPASLARVHQSLVDSFASQGLLVHSAVANAEAPFSIFSTSDGIEAGGRRLAAEVLYCVCGCDDAGDVCPRGDALLAVALCSIRAGLF